MDKNRIGGRGWRSSLRAVIREYNWHNDKNGSPIPHSTRKTILTKAFETLRANGFQLVDVRRFGGRHMKALAKEWKSRGLSICELHQNVLVMQQFCLWIDKPGMARSLRNSYFGNELDAYAEHENLVINQTQRFLNDFARQKADKARVRAERDERIANGRLPFDPPICPYCGSVAQLADSAEVYKHSYGMIWICRPCDSYVGTHKNDHYHTPLGRLANAELRLWKQRAHYAFDPLWKRKLVRDNCSKTAAKGAGYKWLSEQLGIEVKDCHIGMFDVETCKKTVNICAPILDKLKTASGRNEKP